MLIIWTNAFTQPYSIGIISILILQIKKLRPKESAQCPTISKWQGQDLSQSCWCQSS